MKWSPSLCLVFFLVAVHVEAAQRINQEGRILGALPAITNSLLFDTTNADAVVSAMQILPVTNPYNEDVSRLPLATNSSGIIAQISADLPDSRQALRLFQEMNYVLAPDTQPLLSINFTDYPEQSDLNGGAFPNGLYPIPTNMPIEGWPSQTGSETLQQMQMDTNHPGDDRHGIVVQPGQGTTYETWHTLLLTNNAWQAANGAIFNMNTNALRTDGWTSGDAAGLAMFPALVRFDECERGMVEHACRIVVKRSLYNSYIYPATHWASAPTNTLPNLPQMGQRLRLKGTFSAPTNWTIEEKAIVAGLKKYGALVADNGGFFSISIAPDDRWPANAFNDISGIGITNFEVVQATGPTGGPRSPGAPVASAGPDQLVSIFQTNQLQGFVTTTGITPTNHWTLYSGPGTATFGNPALTNSTVSFSTSGVYTLELSAADGVHTVAYAAVVLTVTNSLTVSASRAGANISLNWLGGTPPFVIQQSPSIPAAIWSGIVTTGVRNASIPMTNQAAFFRIQSQ